MNLKLQDKLILLDIDEKSMIENLRKNLFLETSYLLTDDTIQNIKGIMNQSLELQTQLVDQRLNTRASFKVSGDKIIVVKKRKLDVKSMVMCLNEIHNVNPSKKVDVILFVIKMIFINFINIMNSDTALVYSYLSKLYFIDKKDLSIEETYNEVEYYVNDYLNLGWSDKNINNVIAELENIYKVIKFENDRLYIKDKIMFE